MAITEIRGLKGRNRRACIILRVQPRFPSRNFGRNALIRINLQRTTSKKSESDSLNSDSESEQQPLCAFQCQYMKPFAAAAGIENFRPLKNSNERVSV